MSTVDCPSDGSQAKYRRESTRRCIRNARGKHEGQRRQTICIFYHLLYRLPRLVAEGLDDQELKGVIHKTVLHIQGEKWHNCNSLQVNVRVRLRRRTGADRLGGRYSKTWSARTSRGFITVRNPKRNHQRVISTCRRRAPSHRIFRMDVPCCYSWQPDWGQSAGLTHHSILIADPWSPCLPRTHEPRTGRRPVSFAGKRWGIDFPVVAAAPPRYHLVALLLHEPPSSELHTTLRLSQSALPRRSGAGGAITSRMNTYKTFVRLANGNNFCQPDLAARVP